jgi:hypothetical protein
MNYSADDPPPPHQRITRLYAWVAIHDDGGEGILSADLPFPGEGRRHMPLISSKRSTAQMLESLARKIAADAGKAGKPVRCELRIFDLSPSRPAD